MAHVTSRDSSFQLFLVVGTAAATLACYGRLPELVATHWNAAGEANAFMPRIAGAWILPGVMMCFFGAGRTFAPTLARINPEAARALPMVIGAALAVLAAAQAVLLWRFASA